MGLASVYPVMKNLHDLENWSHALQPSPTMPVLFLGHGNPMNALEDNVFVQGFKKLASSLPIPQAILCVSAHYYTNGTKVTVLPNPETIHDFGGFPEALFQVQYPAPGNPALAKEVKDLLSPHPVELDQNWGFDHGSWTVIMHLFPKANIPMIELSLDYRMSPQQHFNLAKQLQVLRKKGVLIVGSGNLVHNLRLVDFANINTVGYGHDWAHEAHQFFNNALTQQNWEVLQDYKNQGKAVQLAVPTPDHFLPLMYTLGLSNKNENLALYNNELVAGSLNMTSVVIG